MSNDKPVYISSGSSSSSNSRSPSPKRKVRLDRFGRIMRPRSRSRSHSKSGSKGHSHSGLVRNRSRSRSHSRFSHRSRGSGMYNRSRSRSRGRRSRSRGRRSRSRSRGRSSFSSKDHRVPNEKLESPFRNRTNIEDPRYLNARVFIGALPVDKVTKEDLEAKFGEYGKVLGVSIHDRGFGFIQFDKEEDAHKAVEQESGSLFKGNVLDVKMAAEGRRNRDAPTARAGGGRSRSPFDRDRGYPSGPGASTSSRDGQGLARDGPQTPLDRERSPIRGTDPYVDRYRDAYRDRALPPPPRAAVERGHDLPSAHLPPPEPRRDERDPYYSDTYRRPPLPDDPYLDRYRDDPYRYRRDPYADPYRDRDSYYRDYPAYESPLARKPSPPRVPSPPDCQIVIMNAKLRKYAEILDEQLRTRMLVEIKVIPEDRTVPQTIEDASLRKCLFAIVLNSQNEAHRSITLNILHGTPQEHRNMPLEDAITLIMRSYEQYVQTAREKAAPKPAPAVPSKPQVAAVSAVSAGPFIPPTADISYLLNLLADNRQLTIEELEKVINYLKERKEKMLDSEGRRPSMDNEGRAGLESGDQQSSQAFLQQQQQELQAKILSILNGSGSGNTPPAGGIGGSTSSLASQTGHHSFMGLSSARGAASNPQPAAAGSSMINFDHPNVQKALDNLIQSGPNLLRSINTSSTAQSPPTASTVMTRGGGTVTGMYQGQQQQQQQQQMQMGYGQMNRQVLGQQSMQSRPLMSQQMRPRQM